tara:strand:- start:266 stop:397 length:132 start_codon:yes stop_codon:yes gene_type:complete
MSATLEYQLGEPHPPHTKFGSEGGKKATTKIDISVEIIKPIKM